MSVTKWHTKTKIKQKNTHWLWSVCRSEKEQNHFSLRWRFMETKEVMLSHVNVYLNVCVTFHWVQQHVQTNPPSRHPTPWYIASSAEHGGKSIEWHWLITRAATIRVRIVNVYVHLFPETIQLGLFIFIFCFFMLRFALTFLAPVTQR